MKYTIKQLNDILAKHLKWLRNEVGGERADLHGVDLHSADLSCADLSGANLRGANLRNADLSGANLRGANLSDANLRNADLSGADLRDADLYAANLCDADLRGANLCDADLRGAKNVDSVHWTTSSVFYPLQCPESGSFVGYKKACGLIVKLEICEDALRSSATSRKCRCSKARVLEIQHLDGSPYNFTNIASSHDPNFIYEVGKTVSVYNFDTNRWNECAPGIHFFITRDEAVKY